jgi:glycosyltransferase involved in cell wall biosynthesis
VPADVIVATSPQLLTGLAGKWLACVKRKPWVFEVRDLWPDSIIAVGAMRENLEIRLLRWIERSLYRSATRIVTVSNALSARLAASGVPETKLAVVTNGVNPVRFSPREKDRALAASLGLENAFVAAYVGSLGAAHGLDTVLSAAKLLSGGDVRFLLVGSGARHAELKGRAAEMGLANVQFAGAVPSEKVPGYLALCDVALVSLRKTPLFRAAIPSKIFEAAAMERPILLAVEGVAADIVTAYGAGVCVPPEDAGAMAAAIRKLRDDPALREKLKEGCRKLARDFDRRMLAEKMLHEIATAALAAKP